MNTRRLLSREDLDTLVSGLLGEGASVIAPARRRESSGEALEYRPVRNPGEMFLSGTLPVRPLKEIVFPPSESLFRWKQNKSSIEIEEVPTEFKEMVVVGARPCDAAALDIVDKVMGWDYRDELWFGRREAATILSLACSECDDACFCTAMGLSPESGRGADGLLIPAGDGYVMQLLTPKGEKLLERFKKRFPETNMETPPSGLEDKLRSNLKADPGMIRKWLETHFEDSYWDDVALRCHGCGACAFVCPTCHCFDIADEPEGIDHGRRRRHWDACQTGLFTVHASGHNPRRTQTARFRQRIMHKFHIYPARFGDFLCTGCGRCIRTCPAGMDLIGILADIGRMAEKGRVL